MNTKHRMVRIKHRGKGVGWNYRAYCVYRKVSGQAGCLWQMSDDGDEWSWFFRTLAEFRRTVDRWERQRARTIGEDSK